MPKRGRTTPAMSQPTKGQTRHSSSSATNSKPTPVPPRPSASILLLSPTNTLLLLHRVKTSTSFPSAHVFPGGNLSSFHEPPLSTADPSHPTYHTDSPAYRLAAIRETFEESGILLAKTAADADSLVTLSEEESNKARATIHADKLHFPTYLADTLRAAPCTEELLPFTRWITPPWGPGGGRRFTTQMYLFFMPLSTDVACSGEVQTPTSDGGVEHTAAEFAPAAEWLAQQARGDIILFPPQCFLLTLIARVFAGVKGVEGRERVEAERKALREFVTTATGTGHPTTGIPWTEKVMSPEILFRRESDGRLVLGVDKPGYELRGSGRGGDWERVVLANFGGKGGPRQVEVRDRKVVLQEEREVQAKKDSKL